MIPYDQHHYNYDRYGNEILVHHDHYYVVPNGDCQCRHESYQHRENVFSFFFGR